MDNWPVKGVGINLQTEETINPQTCTVQPFLLKGNLGNFARNCLLICIIYFLMKQ
jgi:hypothetical protein